jgi:hypothetical protein
MIWRVLVHAVRVINTFKELIYAAPQKEQYLLHQSPAHATRGLLNKKAAAHYTLLFYFVAPPSCFFTSRVAAEEFCSRVMCQLLASYTLDLNCDIHPTTQPERQIGMHEMRRIHLSDFDRS